MHGPTCTFWANLTPFSLKATVPGPACVPCRAGDSHGIFNSSDRPYRWFNINCCMPGQSYDATDLETAVRRRASLFSTRTAPPARGAPASPWVWLAGLISPRRRRRTSSTSRGRS